MENNYIGRPVSRRAAICGVGGAAAAAGLASFVHAAEAANASPADKTGKAAGAKTPFVTIGAESGVLGGGAQVRSIRPGMPAPEAASLETEASGYALVELKGTGDFVKIKNITKVRANTLVVRASIPDSPQGGGITATLNLYVNGTFRQALDLDSKQSWLYRNSTTTPKDPNGGGTPYHFYNEFPVWIVGAAIESGDIIMFRKDADNAASAYHIDCVDLENVPAPLNQPRNSLSVIAYGADPTFETDSTIAIQKAVDEARKLNRSVWIPAGKYMTNSLASQILDFTGVAVQGAGMWHSMIYRNVPLPAPAGWRSKISVGSGTSLTDIQIDSNAVYRPVGSAGGDDYGIEASGAAGWMIDRVWTRHCDSNWLSGSNATVQNCRTADSYGDGFNVNNSNVPNPDKLGYNITVRNNFARGTGDDSFAVYSDAGKSGASSQVRRVKVINNTAVATWWANGIRVAGGREIEVRDNFVDSVSSNSALDIGVFGDTGHALESLTVDGNVLQGGGGWNGARHGVRISSPSTTSMFPTAFTTVTMTNNTLRGALRAGLFIDVNNDNVSLRNNTIDSPANQGILISSSVTGAGAFTKTSVKNLSQRQAAFQNDSPATFVATLKSNSWQRR